jgi:hypothetical protein
MQSSSLFVDREMLAMEMKLIETKRDGGPSLWKAMVSLGESPILVQAFLPLDLAIKVGDTETHSE